MSLMCSTSSVTEYLTLTSSDRHRARRNTAAAASTSTSGDEHWVALNKSTFLEILNEILSQPAIPTYLGNNKSDVTPRESVVRSSRLSPTTVVCRRPSPGYDITSPSNAVASGSSRCNLQTNSPRYVICGESMKVNSAAERNTIPGVTTWNTTVNSQRSAANPVSDVGIDTDVAEAATDLTTPSRRRQLASGQPADLMSSSSSSVCGSRQMSDEAVDMSQSSLHSCSASPGSVHSDSFESTKRLPPGPRGSDVVAIRKDITQGHHPLDTGQINEDLEQLSSTSSSPIRLDTYASIPVINQSPVTCSQVPSDTVSTSGRKADMGNRASWMAVDKTVVCQVVDQMLCRDKMFTSCRGTNDSTFPLPVGGHVTMGSSKAESHNEETTSVLTQRPPLADDAVLRSLISTNSCEPEPSPCSPTSSFHRHIAGSNAGRLRKRSKYETTNYSANKRPCCNPGRRSVHLLPVYAKIQRGDVSCSDEDDDSSADGENCPTFKWKSTMLLRMRRETTTPTILGHVT